MLHAIGGLAVALAALQGSGAAMKTRTDFVL
jgi:hypothetical protein